MKVIRPIYKNIVYCVILGFVILLFINRVQLGIDFTDETWYIAEPYIVSQGAVPYVDNWSQAPGFSIPLFLMFKLFMMFTNSTEGIVLFARLLYVVWCLVISLAFWWVLNKGLQYKLPVIVILPLIFYCPNNIYCINYNTIGIWYLLLASTILLGGAKQEGSKADLCRGFVGGILIARAVIGTPAVVASCFMLGVMLAVYKERYKLVGYIGGGSLTAAIVITMCSIKGGSINSLLQGLRFLLKDGAYFKLEPQISTAGNLTYLFDLFKPFILVSILLIGIFLLLRKHEQLYCRALFGIIFLFLGIGFIKGLISYKNYISYSWFGGLLFFFFLPRKKRRQLNIRIFFDISILYGVTYILTCLTNLYRAYGREYLLFIPCILTYIMLYQALDGNRIKEIMLSICMIGAMCIMVKDSYNNIYRDDSWEKLDIRVQQGIWKGCYTTRDCALAAEALEHEIREITKPEDRVLFLDWVSFGYLMSNGEPCTSSTLDNMLYSYNINNAEIMYDYFQIKGEFPDKIIYVDFGRDEQLSIENDQWKFNDFVNKYYEIETEWESGGYRVLQFVQVSR